MKKLILLTAIIYLTTEITEAQPGKPDPSFGINGTVTTNIISLPGLTQYKNIAIQPDGKLLAFGSTSVNSTNSFVVARYNTDGSLDKSFSDDGKISGNLATYNSIAIQKDGKIVLAGSAVARYNIDGSLDATFSGGQVTVPAFSFSSIAIQKDGKIIAAGVTGDPDLYSESQDFAIARFNPNGTLDNSFANYGTLITNIFENDAVNSIAIQSDGKILVGGNSYDNYKQFLNFLTLVRYTPEGSLDTTFNKNGIVEEGRGEENSSISFIVQQKDGKIVTGDGGEIERHNYDGSRDNSFAVAGTLITPLNGLSSVNIQSDGKFLLSGFEPNGSSFDVRRYTTGGVLDSSFSGDGIQETKITQRPDVTAGVALVNSKIYLAGFNNFNSDKQQGGSGVIIRYSQGSNLDSSYGNNGIVKTNFGSNRGSTSYVATAVQSDGKVVVVGTVDRDTVTDFAITRYNINGSPDSTFSNDGKQTTSFDSAIYCNVRSVAIQSDGKIVVAGDITTSYLNQSIALVRYNADGSLDNTFGNGGKKLDNIRVGGYVMANQLMIQKDGKIVIAGTIDDYIAVVRYNTNGKRDSTFDGDGKQTTLVDNSATRGYAGAIQKDGKIIVAGTSGEIIGYGDTPHFTVVRYNTDGSLDKSFSNDGIQTTAFAYNDFARSIALQADGKILVAGYSYHYPNYKYDYIVVRYNTDGSLDSTFGNNGKQASYTQYTSAFATSVGVEKNGNILVGGYVVKDGVYDFAFTDYYSNGSVNLNFDSVPKETGDVSYDFSKRLTIADDKFYFAGTTSNTFGLLSRYFLDQSQNKAPAISLVNPVNNAVFYAPANITLNAIASDTDGSIATVQFYSGSTLLAADSTSPYSYTIHNLPPGNYSFVAKATDNNGGTNNSATVAVSVSASVNKAPVVRITDPVANATFIAPAGITINATASDTDGTINNVKFFNGSTLLATDSTSPYSYTMNNAAAGTYKFYVQATDNSGLKSSSSTVSVFVVAGVANKAPMVNITSPVNNANYPAVATIVLHATASDADGKIASVQFYNGSTLIKTDNSSPYSCTITHPPAGNYTFSAQAIDNNGLISKSATINVGVASSANKAPVVNISGPANNAVYIASSSLTLNAAASDPDGTISSVKFYNGSTLLATDNTSPYTYTMNNIAAGNYQFYARANDNQGSANSSSTVSVFVVPGASNKAPVVRLINPVNNTVHYAPGTIYMDAAASDPDGTIASVKFYLGTTLLATDSIAPYSYTLTNLPVGNYLFTAKATDNNGLESNSATADVPVLPAPDKAPFVSLTTPVNSEAYNAPATIVLNAAANDPDGTISNVRFFNGPTLIATDSTSPYSFTMNNVAAGSYKFYAKATGSNGLSNSSATSTILVAAVANNAPASIAAMVNNGVSSVNNKFAINSFESVKLFPNPAHNFITIYTAGFQTNKKQTVSIVSSPETVIKTIQTNSSTQTIQLNVSSLAGGMYIIKIVSGNKIIYKQFVKI